MAAKLTFDDLVAAVEPRFGAVRELDEADGLDQLVYLSLARDLPPKKARTALRRLRADFVDWNDVRVTPAHELADLLEGGVAGAGHRRATELLDLLSTLYLRFNKMTADVAVTPDLGPDETKRRTRFLAFLGEKAPLFAALMPLHGAAADDVAAHPDFTRVLSRLGLVDGKATDAAARDAALKKTEPGGRIAVQWAAYRLAAEVCVPKTPLCGECPLVDRCPSAKPPEAPPTKTAKPDKPEKKAAKKTAKAKGK